MARHSVLGPYAPYALATLKTPSIAENRLCLRMCRRRRHGRRSSLLGRCKARLLSRSSGLRHALLISHSMAPTLIVHSRCSFFLARCCCSSLRVFFSSYALARSSTRTMAYAITASAHPAPADRSWDEQIAHALTKRNHLSSSLIFHLLTLFIFMIDRLLRPRAKPSLSARLPRPSARLTRPSSTPLHVPLQVPARKAVVLAPFHATVLITHVLPMKVRDKPSPLEKQCF